MLLSNICKNNRLLMALILRVEERELFQECLALVDSWMEKLEDLGEGYIPPDSILEILKY